MRRFTFWLKSWGALAVAVIALAFSIYAVVVENMHYAELTRPHAQHEEIYDKLTRLDIRLEYAEEYIQVRRTAGDNVTDLELILDNARSLADQAEQAWVKTDYDTADTCIREAFELADKIRPWPMLLPIPPNWWLIASTIVLVVIIAVLFSILARRKIIE
jgi:reverse gyrase